MIATFARSLQICLETRLFQAITFALARLRLSEEILASDGGSPHPGYGVHAVGCLASPDT